MYSHGDILRRAFSLRVSNSLISSWCRDAGGIGEGCLLIAFLRMGASGCKSPERG